MRLLHEDFITWYLFTLYITPIYPWLASIKISRLEERVEKALKYHEEKEPLTP